MRTKRRLLRWSKPCVDQVRRAMMNPGFALVDTPATFRDGLEAWPHECRLVLHSSDRRRFQYPPLAYYACWLENLLKEALPEEPVSLASLELRHEPAGSRDEEVDRLHADGSYIRSVWTPFGPSTIYRDRRLERPVSDGQTLLMTALGRARAVRVPCTLHRRPGAGPERAIVVCSFEPGPEQFPAKAYRKVGRAPERCSQPRGDRLRAGLRALKVWKCWGRTPPW